MRTISLDFETRSTIDLRQSGVYPYARHETTDLWCMAWAVGDGDVNLWLPGDPTPAILNDPTLRFRSWNCQFERTIWREILHLRYGFPDLSAPELWYDTMAEAMMLGLPASLYQAGKVLNAEEVKDDAGHRLMMQMAVPRKPTKGMDIELLEWSPEERAGKKYDWYTNPHIWWDDEERREKLYEYCKDDVRAERSISRKITPLVHHNMEVVGERKVWIMDQEINDRGVPLDMELIRAAKVIADEGVARASVELFDLTDGAVQKPTQVGKMKSWLEEEHGISIDSLSKTAIRDMLDTGTVRVTNEIAPGAIESHNVTLPDEAKTLLSIRIDAGKTSTGKLDKLIAYAGDGDLAQGMLQYHGAATGRWSGRGPQPQNMPRPENEHAEGCPKKPCTCGGVERFIPRVLQGDYDGLETEAPPVSVVSDLLRSCFRAPHGQTFLCGDFSAIEMHVLGWLAGQEDQKSYYEMAEIIFGIPADQIEKGTTEYMVGKVAVLACGYQMGPDKYIDTVKEWTGLDITEPDICEGCANKAAGSSRRQKHDGCLGARAVAAYRSGHDEVQSLWTAADEAFMNAVLYPGKVFTAGRCRFMMAGPFMWIQLPSGRRLAYALPKIVMRRLPKPYEHIEKPAVTVCTVDSETKKWVRRAMYGGLIVENMTQAVARDWMVHSMLLLRKIGVPTVLTVHDEILTLTESGLDVESFERLMTVAPSWAPGLSIGVEAWKGTRYRK